MSVPEDESGELHAHCNVVGDLCLRIVILKEGEVCPRDALCPEMWTIPSDTADAAGAPDTSSTIAADATTTTSAVVAPVTPLRHQEGGTLPATGAGVAVLLFFAAITSLVGGVMRRAGSVRPA